MAREWHVDLDPGLTSAGRPSALQLGFGLQQADGSPWSMWLQARCHAAQSELISLLDGQAMDDLVVRTLSELVPGEYDAGSCGTAPACCGGRKQVPGRQPSCWTRLLASLAHWRGQASFQR